MPHTPDPSPSAERGEKSPWAAGTVMILIDLLPPGLTFQDLVGPTNSASAYPAAPRSTDVGVGLHLRPDRVMRTMELTADYGLLQRYRISERQETSASSPVLSQSLNPQQHTNYVQLTNTLP
jgi:hypothetical protein